MVSWSPKNLEAWFYVCETRKLGCLFCISIGGHNFVWLPNCFPLGPNRRNEKTDGRKERERERETHTQERKKKRLLHSYMLHPLPPTASKDFEKLARFRFSLTVER